METELPVTKLDAARRQVDIAVLLFFHDRDPVSTYTLTAAAYNILRDVNRKRGGRPMLYKEELLKRYTGDMVNEVRRKINEAENFFKHADRDANATLMFRPATTDLMLWECCAKYRELTGEWTPYMQAFNGWMQLTYPKLVILSAEERRVLDAMTNDWLTRPKEQFLLHFLIAGAQFVGSETEMVPGMSWKQK